MTSPAGTAEAPQIEHLLRLGVESLGGGLMGTNAALMFGLESETRGAKPAQLRREAAERWGVSETTFRQNQGITICRQIAEQILLVAHERHERFVYLQMAERIPTASRLSVAWLERFEAYYRIWTPVSGIGADLNAYRLTVLEAHRPYDREPGIDGPDDAGYARELQADGYVTFALWHYTVTIAEVQRFVARNGGKWLLSDTETEDGVADAVYRITWHNPNNEQDDSYLRLLFDQAHGELHAFREILKTDSIGKRIETEWHDWAASCQCHWHVEEEVATEHYPTHRHHDGIAETCQLHAVTTACNDYCTLIDDDWQRIADWYQLPGAAAAPAADRGMYDSLRTGRCTSAVVGTNQPAHPV